VILVAGGSGRLGTLIVRRLAARGLGVRVLTRDRRRTAHLEASQVEVVEGDVRDVGSLGAALERVDTVVSAIHGLGDAGRVSPASVDRDGNCHLVNAAVAANAAVVLMSVVGASAEHPIELFRMKHAAEEHLRASGAAWTIVRATAFAELWLDLLEQTAGTSGRPLIFGRGVNPINFVSASDVAAVVERAVVDPSMRGATFEIGGPQNVSFEELAAGLQRTSGRTAPPRHVPRPMLRLLATVLQPVQPNRARQIRAAIAMDTIDLTWAPTDLPRRFPELPVTSLTDILARRDASQSTGDPRRFPFPPAIPVAALLLSWGVGLLWPLHLDWPLWFRWVGWVLLLTPLALAVSAVRTFRRHHTALNPRGQVTSIVASGPFRYTRNPMYLSLLVQYVGGTLTFRLPWAVILFVPVFLALHFGVILPEETHLAAAFGEPYGLYRKRVRRWL
jgi:uncharacterized protein YbjT (DUF2867 family)/protein-S-isoprenylcysteine O-methyltransferase Ste14